MLSKPAQSFVERLRMIDHAKIVAATVKPPPTKLRVTRWSSPLLAARLGIDNTTAANTNLNWAPLVEGCRSRECKSNPSWHW